MKTPLEVHGVRTPAEYRAAQTAYLRKLRVARPYLYLGDPHVVTPNPPVEVVHGKWIVRCTQWRVDRVCGDLVSVHPDWQLGCCFACGAIYEHIEMPENAAEIDATLSAAQDIRARNWSPDA